MFNLNAPLTTPNHSPSTTINGGVPPPLLANGIKAEPEGIENAPPMPEFTTIEANLYVNGRPKVNKKDRMLCDCLLTKEERKKGVFGCGEDCLNRMLMIECCKKCQLGTHCTNERFQNKQYASVEAFFAGRKGWGLRTTKALPPGAFIMEYVGEVIDPHTFKNRVNKYSKEKIEHHYFMSLKSDEIIDATRKGNIARFINHSCDPNTETQKWTVDGELRIGFFTTRVVEAGEEITLDYQFQRYGKERQKCYCESPACRGYIGASEVTTLDLDGTRMAPKQRAKVADIDARLKAREFEDLALRDEIDKLHAVGTIKNRQNTLTIARIMVRADDYESRKKLLEIIRNTKEEAYLRLFLDYHGLQLLWSWMVGMDDIRLRDQVLRTLEVLPIKDQTILKDSKVLEVVQKWSTEPTQQPSQPSSNAPSIANEDSQSTTSDLKEDMNEPDIKQELDEDTNVSAEAASESREEPSVKSELLKTEEIKQEIKQDEPDGVSNQLLDKADEAQRRSFDALSFKITIKQKNAVAEEPKPEEQESDELPNIQSRATNLLAAWSKLKEGFKIPRLARDLRRKDEEAADNKTRELESTMQHDYMQNNYNFLRTAQRRDSKKLSTDRRFNGQPNGYNFNLGGYEAPIQDPTVPEVPKISKEEHRFNFERKILVETYEEQIKELQEKLNQQLLQQQYTAPVAVPIPCPQPIPGPSVAYHDPQIQYLTVAQTAAQPAMSNGYDYQATAHVVYPTVPIEQPTYLTSYDQHDYSESVEHDVVDYQTYEEEPYEERRDSIDLRLEGLITEQNTLIQLTKEEEYQPKTDGEAATEVDYGVEYVSVNSKRNQTFNDQFAESGVYYEYDSYVMKLPFDHQGPNNMEYIEDKLPHLHKADDTNEPLPPNWRRATSTRTGQTYYYNKKTGKSRWQFPKKHVPANKLSYAQIVNEKAESEPSSSYTPPLPLTNVSSNTNSIVNEPILYPTFSSLPSVSQPTTPLTPLQVPLPVPPPSTSTLAATYANGGASPLTLQQTVLAKANFSKKPVDEELERRKRKNAEILNQPSTKSRKANHNHRSHHSSSQRSHHTSKSSKSSKSSYQPIDPKKMKEKLIRFKKDMVNYIKKLLMPYQKSDCKVGRITNKEDFKFLCQKLSSEVINKQRQKMTSIKDLDITEEVKQKTKAYVKKYMASKGRVYNSEKDKAAVKAQNKSSEKKSPDDDMQANEEETKDDSTDHVFDDLLDTSYDPNTFDADGDNAMDEQLGELNNTNEELDDTSMLHETTNYDEDVSQSTSQPEAD